MKVGTRLRLLWSVRTLPAAIAIFALVVIQFYAMRELVAAEALFAVAFIFLSLIVAGFYFVGSIAERGAEAVESGIHTGTQAAQRGYHDVEHVTQKWMEGTGFFNAHR